MLARMDIVSVNCPHTPATYHLLSARRLKLMRPDAILVNTARGEIIDEGALTKLIEGGRHRGRGARRVRGGAGGQSAPRAPRPQGKVVLLPHMGSATREGRIAMGEKVIVNIRAFVMAQDTGSGAAEHALTRSAAVIPVVVTVFLRTFDPLPECTSNIC
jgi:glyoxylate reductase